MSQLTFGESFGDKKTDTAKSLSQPKKESWYKGRTLSHSSVSTYQQCPQKWKLRYVDKIPEKPKSYFSFGKSVHSGLEFLYEKEAFPTLDDLLAQFKKGWISEGYESVAQEKWFFKEGERILKGFYAKHESEEKNVFQVELKFSVDIEGVPLIGYIDRIDLNPNNKLSIIDYKTGKAFDKSRARKDPQLTLYQMACKTLLNKEVDSLTLYHLNSLTPITVPSHSAQLEDNLKTVIVDTAKGISAEKFEPKPEPRGYCRWCDYIQVCPAFSGKKLPIGVSEAINSELKEDVDRFGKLDSRLKELQVEHAELKNNLMAQMGKKSVDQLKGNHYEIQLKNSNGSNDIDVTLKGKES